MDMTILTDVGQRRTNNQDYANQYTNKAGKPMVFLADGMGGHRAGNIASEMAVTDLGAAWVSSEIETVNQVREWFAEHLEAVNRRIHLAGQDDEHKGMGTTLEALAFVEGQVIYAHVGDCEQVKSQRKKQPIILNVTSSLSPLAKKMSWSRIMVW